MGWELPLSSGSCFLVVQAMDVTLWRMPQCADVLCALLRPACCGLHAADCVWCYAGMKEHGLAVCDAAQHNICQLVLRYGPSIHVSPFALCVSGHPLQLCCIAAAIASVVPFPSVQPNSCSACSVLGCMSMRCACLLLFCGVSARSDWVMQHLGMCVHFHTRLRLTRVRAWRLLPTPFGNSTRGSS